MSSTQPVPPAADDDGMPTDPLYAHVMGGQMGICYILTMAGCGVLLGSYGFPIILWCLSLPISAYVCVQQTRRLGRSPWLGLLCSPLPPLSLWILNRVAAASAPRSVKPVIPMPVSEGPRDNHSGRAA